MELIERRETAPAVAKSMKVIRAIGRIRQLSSTTNDNPVRAGNLKALEMENRGFEPLTSAVRSQRSTN